jgi:hypothetical protein
MKTLFLIIYTLSLLSTITSASLPSFGISKINVSGEVVDFDKRDNVYVVILKDHKGWDRKQAMPPSGFFSKSTNTWINNIDKNHAIIFVNKDIKNEIRRGRRLSIDGYTYYIASQISPSYDKFTVTK